MADIKNAGSLERPGRFRNVTLKVTKDIKRNGTLYLIVMPVIIYYLIFHYRPLGGIIIAFKDYKPVHGIFGSPWTSKYGFHHFIEFLKSPFFGRLIRNTILISLYNLIFGFPAPIILALMISEVRNRLFKKTIQTVTYFPHFLSQVVVCGIITEFCLSDGLFNQIRGLFGLEPISMLQKPELFRTIYVGSSIWQEVGWNSIIYLAAIAGIEQQLYEAARLDGAGKFRIIWHITLPGIKSVAIILFILSIGKMMNVGAEKILLLYNEATYETADVISTYVYRRGLLEFNWSFSTAVDLFNSIINFSLVIAANRISRKVTETSLF